MTMISQEGPNTNSTDRDEELARELQDQFHRELQQQHYPTNHTSDILPIVVAIPEPDDKPIHAGSFSTQSTSTSFDDTLDRDEQLARKLDVELRDEALAEELQARLASDAFQSTEGDEALARRLQGRRRGIPPDRRGRIIYLGTRIVSAVLVIGVSYLVFVTVFGNNVNAPLDPASWLPGWPENDPSFGTVGENSVWDTNNGFSGLTLQVLNNLNEGSDWNQHFETAISEWDNGTPDSVTLSLRSSYYDPDCRAVRKAMKVCNGNYGPTDWRGVNQILLQDDYIITSLAKMNDYYMEGTDVAQKQYTMCHELGHGLGLGHTDENFYNRDLGNCMDYTERPENNMHPDQFNFDTLEGMYGNVDGTSVRGNALEGGGRRAMTVDEGSLEEEFRKFAVVLSDPVKVSRQDEGTAGMDGWRVLKTEFTQLHERDLGNGYSIRTSILLA